MGAETIHDFRSHVDPPAFTGLTAFRCLLPERSAASPRARPLGLHNRCGFERDCTKEPLDQQAELRPERAQDFGAHEVGEVTISSRLAEDDAASRLGEEILRFTIREMVFQQPKP